MHTNVAQFRQNGKHHRRHTKGEQKYRKWSSHIWLAQVGGNQEGLPEGEGISSKALKKSKQSMDAVFITLCFKGQWKHTSFPPNLSLSDPHNKTRRYVTFSYFTTTKG